MTKKDSIALADYIKAYNRMHRGGFTQDQLDMLVNFCAEHNPHFKRNLWLDYIASKCGPTGGKL